MRRPLRAEEARLWAVVAATVRPGAKGQPSLAPPVELSAPPHEVTAGAPPTDRRPPALARRRAEPEQLAVLLAAGVGAAPGARPLAAVPPARPPTGPQGIEPNRRRRIARAREPIGARLDLHGHDQDRARAALHDFLLRAHEDGARAVLVITGKGRMGGGVLRARAPEWLAEAPARRVVAGVSPAEARHGGEGALYIALKRRD